MGRYQNMKSLYQGTVLIFIDTTVDNYEDLARGIVPGTQVILLNPKQDGVEQITQILSDRALQSNAPQIQTLHLVSHGSPGCLYLGNTQLNLETLDRYRDHLQQWGNALSQDGEILIYGCNVAASTNFVRTTPLTPFIQHLHYLTGVHIAASATPVGNQKLGGNWQLEVRTGQMTSPLAFEEATQQAYAGVLAEFVVINTDNDGPGSLRDAINQANANAEDDTITFDPALAGQTINLTNEIGFTAVNNITINGLGKENLTINGNSGSGLIFRVETSSEDPNNPESPAAVVRITDLTLQDGATAIRHDGLGSLEVDNSIIQNNTAFGIVGRAQTIVTNSTIQQNSGQAGISISGSNSIIEGNTIINNTGNGIRVFTQTENITSNVRISGNLIGVASDGTESSNSVGISVNGANATLINQGNVISGNFVNGVVVEAASDGTIIQGNIIGLNPDGTSAVANAGNGIQLDNATNSIIGGGEEGQRNVISGNGNDIFPGDGILITNGSTGSQIQGNFIGLNQAGDAAVGNTLQGIRLDNVSENTISAGNVISGNGANGIFLIPGSASNTIAGNLIGLNAAGTTAIPNTSNGIFLDNAASNIIGGVEPGQGNFISGNGTPDNPADGIFITNASTGNQIQGNFIGLNQAGDGAVGNTGQGIRVQGATGNSINGRNVISGNVENGISLVQSADTNTVTGNFIGLDGTGQTAIPNGINGIQILNSIGNIIGGGELPQRNIISGNTEDGILITNTAADTQIIGNSIGTNLEGTQAVPNAGDGIEVNNATNTSITGSNLISGNSGNGIFLTGNASNTTVQGNLIGVDAGGTTGLPNTASGVLINTSASNTITANTIAFNNGDGVTVVNDVSTGNLISQNSIFSNGDGNAAIGIDLADDGVTANDPADADTGPNTLLNYPELVMAEPVDTGIAVAANFNSTPSTAFQLEFFASAAADASGNVQGQTFLGSFDVTTDAAGNAQFIATLPDTGDISGQFITATAKDPATNNTSEFSNAVSASSPQISITPVELPVIEGNTGTIDYAFTVTLDKPSTQEITVNYTTNDGTATLADNDYVDNDGSLVFPANPFGENAPTSQTITVQGNGDVIAELDETFTVTIESPNTVGIVEGTATGTIVNDEPLPSISIGDVSVNEADGQATFTITASEASGLAISFDVVTTDGSAIAGSDYTAFNQTVEIPIGETSVTVDVPIVEDLQPEPDEVFTVTLQNAVGIDADNSILTATGTIVNDDFAPSLTLSAEPVSFTEGESPVNISSTVEITDQDSTTLTSATVTLTNPLDIGAETLAISGSLPLGITASAYDFISGQLTLTGNATLADYQSVLSQIVYSNTSNTPNLTPRQVEVVVNDDGANPSNTGVATINLTAVNTPPIATNDAVNAIPATPVTFNVTMNDFDLDGTIDPSTVSLDTSGLTAQESATVDSQGNVTFTPGSDLSGTVTIPYTIQDSEGATSDPGQIEIFVDTTVNLPPTANNLIALDAAIPALSATDLDGTITQFEITRLPDNGQLLLNGELVSLNQTIAVEDAANLTFTPLPGFSGIAQFEYTAFDDDGAADLTASTVTIPVNLTTVPPVPNNNAVPLLKNVDQNVSLPPLTAINNETVASFTIVELPIAGQVFLNGEAVTVDQVIPADQAGQLTFTSDVNFSGQGVLKYTTTDTQGVTSEVVGHATVFILPNILPIIQPIDAAAVPNSGTPFALPALSAIDLDGEVVSFGFSNIPTGEQGTLRVNQVAVTSLEQVSELTFEQASQLQIVANPGFVGDIVLNYFATDSDGQSSEPLPLTIPVIQGAPPSGSIPVSQTEPISQDLVVSNIPNNGTAIAIPPLVADDPNDEIVSFEIIELPNPAQGQLLLNGVVVTELTQVAELSVTQASQLTFIPAATFAGSIRISYRATNSRGVVSSSSSITLEIPSQSTTVTPSVTLSIEVLTFTSVLAGIQLSLGELVDTIILNPIETPTLATEDDDVVIGSEESEEILGLGGNDDIDALGGDDNVFGNSGDDSLNGGEGNDVVFGGVDNDVVFGGLGDDTLNGGEGNDSLIGGSEDPLNPDAAGEDLIFGGDGDDSLSGNQGNDTLVGGEGNDIAFGGQDDDIVTGEAGDDTLFGDLGNDTLSGGDGNDLMFGNEGNDSLSGGDGNDTLYGGQDNDLLFGDDGNDQLFGDLGDDSLYGNQGNDILQGGEGNDTLIGGEDNDTLLGQAGEDVLSGGSGSDIFALAAQSGADVIVDFADGQDLLGLTLGLSFDDLTIDQGDSGTLILLDGELLVTLNTINITFITEDDFTTV